MTGAPFAAAVLAGGRSRRMGTDKALVVLEGRTMVERVVERARLAGADPVAVVGHRHPELLPPGVSSLHIPDEHPGAGPVGGLLTALSWTPQEVVLVVACDLPLLDPFDLARLTAAVRPGRPAAVLVGPRRREPLVGAWSRAIAGDVERAFESGVSAVHVVLDGLGEAVAEVPVSDTATLRNVNRPADIPKALPTTSGTASPDRGMGGLG